MSETTQKLARAELENIEYTTIAELRDKTIAILNKYSLASGEIAGGYGASFFDEVMAENDEDRDGTNYSFTATEANDKAVRGMINNVATGGSVASFFDAIQDRLDYNIRRTNNECILANVKGRKLKYARVPSGRETCAFCFMLASRGFVYWSRSSAGEFDHYHSDCRCRIVPGFDDIDPDTQVEGYEPSKYYKQYKDCYDAVRDPNGMFDYDLYLKDVAKGKYGTTSDEWQRWKDNRLMKEIRSRDVNWRWTGEATKVTFENKELEKKIRTKRPHEIATAKRLSEHGIKCHFKQDVNFNYDNRGNNKGLPDLENGYELKTLSKASSYNTLNDYLKGINKTKVKVKTVVFDNSKNRFMSDEDLIKNLKRSRSFHQGKIYVLTKDGGYYSIR